MIWESALFAGHHKLNNLYVFVDYNRQQGFGTTDEILSLDSLKDKFLSFKWNVYEINGHNFKDMLKIKKNSKVKTKNLML